MAHALRSDGPISRPGTDPDGIAVGIEAAGWLPAFTAASQVMTGEGPVAAGWLRPGDPVLTRDSGLQPVVWVGRC